MLAYSYDEQGYFLGEVECQPNPKVLGQFLIPKNSTTEVPPTPSDSYQIAKFDGSWSLVENPFKLQEDIELMKLVNAEGVPLYKLDTNGKPIQKTNEELATETAEEVKQSTIRSLKATCDMGIYLKVKEVSGADSFDSALAFVASYQLRAANASEYVSDGLVVGYAIGSFALNDALDTEQKIKDYYNALLVMLDKHRAQKIQEYLTAKNAL